MNSFRLRCKGCFDSAFMHPSENGRCLDELPTFPPRDWILLGDDFVKMFGSTVQSTELNLTHFFVKVDSPSLRSSGQRFTVAWAVWILMKSQ